MGLKKDIEPIPDSNCILTFCKQCRRDVVAKITKLDLRLPEEWGGHIKEDIAFCVNCHEVVN